MVPRWVIPLLLGLLLNWPAAAGKAGRLHKLMAKERYRDVLEEGGDYLDSEKVRPDRKEVQLLMDRAAYLIASRSNEASNYVAYLRLFPSSAYADRVKEQLADLEYQSLLDGRPSIQAYQSFQRRFPRSSFIVDSRIREEEMAWKQARTSGSLKAIKSFQRRYPSGHFIRAAKEEEAARAYRAVQQADDLQIYLGFLRQYPGSRYAAEARQRSEELAWSQAKTKDDVAAYREFREIFRDGPRVDQAFTRELDLAWDSTRRTHKISTYRAFEKAYAENDLALEAESREWDLYHYQRSPYPGELSPHVTRIFREEDGSYRLFLDVVNADESYVGGLSADNFQVYDSGFRAEVLSLEGMEANRPVDIVFVLDTTGSMAREIEGVKDGIIRFSEIMRLRSRDARYGLVTFGDSVRNVAPFTHRVAEFQGWVAKETATGGGDDDENPLDGLDTALSFRMRKDAQHIFVVITDAGAHERDWATSKDFDQMTPRLSDEDVQVYIVGPSDSNYRDVTEKTWGEHYLLDDDDFDETMEAITQKVSKQYRLRYRRPPEAPPVLDALNVRIRIKRDHAWVARADPSESSGGGTGVVSISPHDSLQVFRGLVTSGLRCSRDGGGSWEECGGSLPEDTPVADIVPDGATRRDVWVRTDDGRLWKSDDGGSRFSEASLDGPPAVALFTAPSDSGARIAFDGSHLWWNKSGSHWRKVSDWLVERPISVIAGRKDSDGLILIISEDGTLHRSTDEGQTFEKVEDVPWTGDSPPSGISFHPSREGLVIAYGGDRLYRSLDDGLSWRAVDLRPAITGDEPVKVRHLVFDPTVRQMHLVTTDHGVLASHDLGRTWSPTGVGMAGDEALGAAAVGKDGRVLMGASDSGVVYSLEPVANREFVFSKVFFGSGATRPDGSLLPHLNDVGRALLNDRSARLLVEGHADSVGSEKLNQEISRKRAEWVVAYLADQGVPAERMSVAWFGEQRPLFDNASSSGRSKNRRVEMVLIGAHKPLPGMERMR